ncbi:phage major tail protein, TP901-1 family [Mordavella massiliensis]|uniref:Phage major tail protein, TP901-1 family n=1 Tax=Merdimonas faecis TaxID=1653435 RepID=A0A9D2VXD8_9FIRM|nr:phage major tail protein, TP901-1 family [Merdimonas faecis]MBM6971038.1 phage major tail protein, TP901-1 family [Mordavella massiliensis]HJH49326.1 phage major tail protein, TP901-1 family [Merdimonas faecis]
MSAIQGKRIIYLYRILKDAATADAKALAFTTENERTKSRDADTTETKDGPIRTPGALETEITTTAIFSSESDEMIAKLEKAVDDSEKVEIWEVNLDKPGTSDNVGKFAAKYFQGYVTEFGSTSSAEDHAEASLTFGIEGTGADGYATVSDEQQEIASYVFADTEKTGA